MLTFLHIVYSKNRTEDCGCCAAKKKQKIYKNVDQMMINNDMQL